MMLETTWAEQERWLAGRPVCDACMEPIQDDSYFAPEPGDCFCQECFEEYARSNYLRVIK